MTFALVMGDVGHVRATGWSVESAPARELFLLLHENGVQRDNRPPTPPLLVLLSFFSCLLVKRLAFVDCFRLVFLLMDVEESATTKRVVELLRLLLSNCTTSVCFRPTTGCIGSEGKNEEIESCLVSTTKSDFEKFACILYKHKILQILGRIYCSIDSVEAQKRGHCP